MSNATAELMCRLTEPATLVFSAWPGLTPEFARPEKFQDWGIHRVRAHPGRLPRRRRRWRFPNLRLHHHVRRDACRRRRAAGERRRTIGPGQGRYSPQELAQGLELKNLPLRSDASIYLPPGAKPAFPAGGGDVVRLKSVKVIREFQIVLPVERSNLPP